MAWGDNQQQQETYGSWQHDRRQRNRDFREKSVTGQVFQKRSASVGLDITAYRQLRRDWNPILDSDGEPKDYNTRRFKAYAVEHTERDWPGHAAGLEHHAVYSFAESFDFTAGSYSGYNWWRNQLAIMAGHASAEAFWANIQPGPFAEIIHFTDCDGVMGAKVCAKLHADFRDNHAKAVEFAERLDGRDGTYFLRGYENFAKAFEMAADSGAVSFH